MSTLPIQPTYSLIVRNHDGDRVATFAGLGRGRTGGGLQSFVYRKRLRTPGTISVRIYGDDERIPMLLMDDGLDYQWVVRRTDFSAGLTEYTDFVAFNRMDETTQREDGEVTVVFYGDGLNVLLFSDTIQYATGTTQAQKSGDASAVAYEFVDENIGPNAGVDSEGYSRVRQGLSLAPVTPSGFSWVGNRSYRLLADVLEELAEFSGADYNIEDLTAEPSGSPILMRWEWRNTRWGLDRRPGNTAGNRPMIFSPELGNMQFATIILSRLNDISTCYALGQGTGTARLVGTYSDPTVLAKSPWARRAISRNLNNEPSLAGLVDYSQATVEDGTSKRRITFKVNQTYSSRYGRDWDIGDLVRVRDIWGRSLDLKIVGVTISVKSNGREDLTVEFEEE